MSLQLKDRVKQVTTTTGTGMLTLVSTPSGFQSFSSVLSNGDTTYYCIESGANWEIGIGTYTSNTLARTTVLASSNSNSLINITATRSFVFISYIADKAVYKDSAGRVVSGAAGIIFSDASVQTTALTAPNWGSIGGVLANQTDLTTALGLKATLASPTFTGVPIAPTAAGGTNTTQIATTAFVTTAVAAIDLSPYLTSVAAAAAYVALAGSYTNPSWLVSIPNTKVTGLGTLSTQNGTFSGTSSGTNTGDQDLSSYLTTSVATATYVPYTGATTNLALGTRNITSVGAITASGVVTITQPVSTSGSPTALTLTGAAHTTLTASTEATDVNFNLARTVQFATGAIATQRAMRIQAPTYGFVGASTITEAITLYVDSPVAGTNCTIAYGSAIYATGAITASSVGSTDAKVTYRFQTSPGCGFRVGSSGEVRVCFNGTPITAFDSVGMYMANRPIYFSATSEPYATASVGLFPLSAGLAIRNSTTAMILQVTGAYTSSTSYELINIKGKAGANFEIGPEAGSAGGTLQGLTIGGYAAGTSTITPWLRFTNTGAATFDIKSSFPLGFQVGSYGHFRSDATYGMIQSSTNGGTGTATAVASFLPSVTNTFSLGEVGYTGWAYLLLQSTSGSAVLRPVATNTVEIRNSTNTAAGNLSCATITASGIVTLQAPVTLKNYTVATLPAGVQGHKAFVTDALAPTYLVAVVGGGAVVTEVFYNGTNWVCT